MIFYHCFYLILLAKREEIVEKTMLIFLGDVVWFIVNMASYFELSVIFLTFYF